MADQPPPPEKSETTTGAPRWVKVFGIAAAILVALIIVMLLTGHGPGRHLHHGLGEVGAVQPWS